MSINLAPSHKRGLTVENQILLAGGSVGYGEAIHRGVKTQKLGAVVVGPLMRSSRAGSPPPRLGETVGGFVLDSGLQNRGVSSAIKKFARTWLRLGCPVVAQVADSQPDALSSVLEKLMLDLPAPDAISGIELLLAPQVEAQQLQRLVETVRLDSDYPVWVKLPLQRTVELTPVAVEAGADALVVAQPPNGAAPSTNGATVRGALLGPSVSPLMFRVLEEVVALNPGVPLIACGGIHTVQQVQQALRIGADAVQIDSAVWVEPGLPNRLVASLSSESA